MKPLLYCLALPVLFACNQNRALVKESFVDSLFANYAPSMAAVTNAGDLDFWEKRVKAVPESLPDLEKYAAALATRFNLYGDINDLRKADSIMETLVRRYKDPGQYLALAGYQLLQHRFAGARKYIDTVVAMRAEKYAAQMMLFDAVFEQGDLYHASLVLKNNHARRNYAYHFRRAKLEHEKGAHEDAIAHMLTAAELSGPSTFLHTAALSNAADFYLHDGNAGKAVELYMQCLRINSSHFHSIMELAWIALVHDENEQLAGRMFSFVKNRVGAPEPLYKMALAAELSDSSAARKYALEFVRQAAGQEYGNMYNKYLVEMYTGVLNDPAAALTVAQKEIKNRATSQTYAWLAWCLYKNGRSAEARSIYDTYVSGKELEPIELFWMGKMMKETGKEKAAGILLNAAKKDQYELSPATKKELEELIFPDGSSPFASSILK